MLWAWIMSFGIPFPFLALRAEKQYRALQVLPVVEPGAGPLPALSVIVPARNEAHHLSTLLPSLLHQEYPGALEILVVDDGSTDRTAQVALELGAAVHTASALPAGWNGKPHACHTGARKARGDWLLFVDADTWFHPGSFQAAVRYALAKKLDGLSLLLAEDSTGLLERLAMMTAFAGLFAGMLANRPVLNGQFILLRKEAYFASGGFEKVRAEALEDLALAHLLQRSGHGIPIVLGLETGQVRMYAGPRHLWTGLVRLGSGALRWSGPGGWLTALFITGALLPVAAIPLALFAGMPLPWLVFSWLIVALGFIPWAGRSGRTYHAFLAPIGALFVQLAAVTGLLRTFAGAGIPWKGRRV